MAVKEERWMIDSIEEATAAMVAADGKVHQIPGRLLPAGAREGDICTVIVNRESTNAVAVTSVTIDKKATKAALERSAAQLAAAPKSKDPGGPIKL